MQASEKRDNSVEAHLLRGPRLFGEWFLSSKWGESCSVGIGNVEEV